MAEARDRLVRPVDMAEIFVQRRHEVLAEIQGSTTGSGTEATLGPGSSSLRRVGRGRFGTPRYGGVRGRYLNRSPLGRENTPLRRNAGRLRGRSGHSVLPSWYPRTPLRDISAVVRAIERRRSSLRQVDGDQIENPITNEAIGLDSSDPLSSVQLEHNSFVVSTVESLGSNICTSSGSKVPEILHDVTKETAGDSECLTPQKKLLDRIDSVEKVVMEELQKQKRTPAAKKAERQKKVRTLMSMR